MKVINPLHQPVTVQKVTYSISRPAGQVALTGMAVCNESFAGAAQAALGFAAATALANIAPDSDVQGSAVKNGVTSFSLPAAPATLQPTAPPKSPAATKSPPRLKFFNIDISLLRGNKSKAGDSASDDGQEDNPGMDSGSDPLEQSGPEPYYCSFVVNTPDDFASDVSVTVMTDRMEEVKAAAPYNLEWSLATSYETGRWDELNRAALACASGAWIKWYRVCDYVM